jgi:hypothetical protein
MKNGNARTSRGISFLHVLCVPLLLSGIAGVRDAHHRKIDPVLEELLCIPILEDLR